MATRLDAHREKAAELGSEARVELKDGKEVFHPNIFIKIVDGGVRIYSEQEGSEVEGITLPDAALLPTKKHITYLLGTAS
jgi:hypothetical protein